MTRFVVDCPPTSSLPPRAALWAAMMRSQLEILGQLNTAALAREFQSQRRLHPQRSTARGLTGGTRCHLVAIFVWAPDGEMVWRALLPLDVEPRSQQRQRLL
jgi:hypothetical protein